LDPYVFPGRHKKLQFKAMVINLEMGNKYHISKYHIKMIKTTIEQNRSPKKAKKNLAQGRQNITSILDSNGQEITDQEWIEHCATNLLV